MFIMIFGSKKVNENSECEIGENMRHHDDEWLQQKIDEDMIAMADARERVIKASRSYQHIDMSEEKMQELRARILQEMELREAQKARQEEEQKLLEEQQSGQEEPMLQEVSEPKDGAISEKNVQAGSRVHKKLRIRPVLVAAAVLVLCLGTGLVSMGNRVYIPEIFERSYGDEETLKINNTEAVATQYDEEEICVEIQERLGVIPIRFGYRPRGMLLTEYDIRQEETDALMEYEYDGMHVYVYISKDWHDSSISNQIDGEKIDKIMVTSCGLEIPVYEYKDPYGEKYYEASFEYLNTYYSINGMIELEEFKKILENIAIKNA